MQPQLAEHTTTTTLIEWYLSVLSALIMCGLITIGWLWWVVCMLTLLNSWRGEWESARWREQREAEALLLRQQQRRWRAAQDALWPREAEEEQERSAVAHILADGSNLLAALHFIEELRAKRRMLNEEEEEPPRGRMVRVVLNEKDGPIADSYARITTTTASSSMITITTPTTTTEEEEFRPRRRGEEDEEEECPICKERVQDAWLLPCEHRVCSVCAHRLIVMEQHATTTTRRSGCPFCRGTMESAIVAVAGPA